jgi:hypothetical protein
MTDTSDSWGTGTPGYWGLGERAAPAPLRAVERALGQRHDADGLSMASVYWGPRQFSATVSSRLNKSREMRPR